MDYTLPVKVFSPIYDAVFKFLMQDIEVAKVLISHIIDQPIAHLQQLQTENYTTTDAPPQPDAIPNQQFIQSRFDYLAQIEIEDNEKYTILIELQKVQVYNEVGRFRNYTGTCYSISAKGNTLLIIIYILGFVLKGVSAPIVRTRIALDDVLTGNPIHDWSSDFVKGLMHVNIFIQTPLITGTDTDLELLLSMYADQKEVTMSDARFAEKFGVVLDRLVKATQDPVTIAALEREVGEKERLNELINNEALMYKERAEKERALKQLAKEKAAKQAERKAKEDALHKEVLALQKEALALQKEALALQKEALALQKIKNTVNALRAKGMSDAEIAAITQLTIDEVKGL